MRQALIVGAFEGYAKRTLIPRLLERGIAVRDHWTQETTRHRTRLPKGTDLVLIITTMCEHPPRHSAIALAKAAGVPVVETPHKLVALDAALARARITTEEEDVNAFERHVEKALGLLRKQPNLSNLQLSNLADLNNSQAFAEARRRLRTEQAIDRTAAEAAEHVDWSDPPIEPQLPAKRPEWMSDGLAAAIARLRAEMDRCGVTEMVVADGAIAFKRTFEKLMPVQCHEDGVVDF